MENRNPEKEEQNKPILEFYEYDYETKKPEDYIVDGKQWLIPPNSGLKNKGYKFRIENLPKREKGAMDRVEGAIFLIVGLTCNSCSHNMPVFSKVLGYVEIFPAKDSSGERLKQHLYCCECSSEMIVEGRTIISGATEFTPPGTESKLPRSSEAQAGFSRCFWQQ